MFTNYSPISIYLYLEFLFFSLTVGLVIAKVGADNIRLILKEIIRSGRWK